MRETSGRELSRRRLKKEEKKREGKAGPVERLPLFSYPEDLGPKREKTWKKKRKKKKKKSRDIKGPLFVLFNRGEKRRRATSGDDLILNR